MSAPADRQTDARAPPPPSFCEQRQGSAMTDSSANESSELPRVVARLEADAPQLGALQDVHFVLSSHADAVYSAVAVGRGALA